MELDKLYFGAQYYRFPTPRREEWARDLNHMRECGFNTVRFWSMWRANNPREGVYDFSDIDELMELARVNGLYVILSPIMDNAPAWFFEKYPEAMMVTNGKGTVYPTTNACRQLGGAPGPCYHHEAGIQARRAFIEALVRRYHQHPMLVCWDMWSEPEHTCCLHRSTEMENLTCYCKKSEERFKAWLGKRYGSIGGLNRKWGRTYEDFGQVELPRRGDAFNDMIDWRLFMTDTITEEARMRMEALRSIDRVHPGMIHTVTLPFFPLATCGSDDVAIARECDMFGNSVGSEPLSAAISISAAEGKPVINAEIHAVGGSTYARPKVNTLEDMKRHIFVPLGLGVKGFIFWQFRPERLGLESPAWGLTGMDGKDTPWLKAAVRLHEALKRGAGTILKSAPPECGIAIVADKRSQLFDFCVDCAGQRYTQSIQGACACLRNLGYAPRVVTELQLNPEGLRDISVLYDPFPYYKDKATADAIREWVKGGGVLISEACFGDYDGDEGLSSLTQPGFGFADVFGAEQAYATSASHFANAYDEGWANGQGGAPVKVGMEGSTYAGELMVQGLSPTSARVLARFPDGTAAATLNRYGEGQAVWIGTLPMLAYQHGHRENSEFLGRILAAAGVDRPALDAGRPGVCATLCAGPEGGYVVVCNESDMDGVRLTDRGGLLRGKVLVDMLTGASYAPEDDLPVSAGSAEGYWVE